MLDLRRDQKALFLDRPPRSKTWGGLLALLSFHINCSTRPQYHVLCTRTSTVSDLALGGTRKGQPLYERYQAARALPRTLPRSRAGLACTHPALQSSCLSGYPDTQSGSLLSLASRASHGAAQGAPHTLTLMPFSHILHCIPADLRAHLPPPPQSGSRWRAETYSIFAQRKHPTTADS